MDFDSSTFAALADAWQWKLSLFAFASIMAVFFVGGKLLTLVPSYREAIAMNRAAYAEKMGNPRYAANQKWNRKWGLFDQIVIFAGILPFCLTLAPQPWWQVLRDTFVILMVYDFFYYLVHRFLFHDEGFFGGPLIWVHAVHHRQKDPCRGDSSFIHPIEVALGLGLYAACIFVLSRLMGPFSVTTIVVTWVAFSAINQHNHDLWKAAFPVKYLGTMSVMHHNHHSRFIGGNFATISLLYDWLLGTIDDGLGGKEARRGLFRKPAATTALRAKQNA